ncbi:hypothetical protein Dsin_029823 [Dipteronia sinensis]|uniref:Uncharacterized protein n=1 Tax=Dipteronia sinensis TaxID=43782 RepID=A0AAD9ZTH8_9ROSI|nr:hypothetical protein Dsin_029823 [Dipteronia sinensis]
MKFEHNTHGGCVGCGGRVAQGGCGGRGAQGPRRRFREQEWEDFTLESTQQALAQHFASPEFTAWMVEHAQQIKLFSSDTSDTESTNGNLDSSD